MLSDDRQKSAVEIFESIQKMMWSKIVKDFSVLLQIDDTPCTIGQIDRAHQRVWVPRCRSSEEVPISRIISVERSSNKVIWSYILADFSYNSMIELSEYIYSVQTMPLIRQ